jgi:hypothetical protein
MDIFCTINAVGIIVFFYTLIYLNLHDSIDFIMGLKITQSVI